MLFETLAQLPPAHLAYIGLVISAFTAFGATLASVHIWSNLPGKRRAAAPAIAVDETVEYAKAA